MKQYLQQNRDYLGQLSRSLNGVSPLRTLARGYSITYDENGEVLRDSDGVKTGSSITTQLDKGQISSTVTEVKSEIDAAGDSD